MLISVYGAGYIGLVTAVCLAKLGHRVLCVDINQDRITALTKGECPIYEDNLPQLLNEQILNGRLQFTTELSTAVTHAFVHMIATGTPSLADGCADLSQVFGLASTLARETNASGVVIIKSTVPVGTGDELQAHLNAELMRLNKTHQLEVVSNPEFLREGTAVFDFLHADRIIVGGQGTAVDVMKEVYLPLIEQGIPLLLMSRPSAELTKYAANSMLACKISFINQISRIAEKVGANIDDIRHGISLDHRIGPHFLQAGIGYGGSCFPKDGRALLKTAQSFGVATPLLEAIETINHIQNNWVVEQLNLHFHHSLQHKNIGIWGLSFKPGTDDVREASSLSIINALWRAGAKLYLYDPVAMSNARALVPQDERAITWCNSAENVLKGQLDALVIATEWPIFKDYSKKALHDALQNAPIIDGRNCFDLVEMRRENISYYSVGRPIVKKDSL